MPTTKERVLRAFTLIEVLVCVTVISVLVFLTSSIARSTRTESRLAQDLSNLRQHGTVHLLYTADFNGHFFAPGAPDQQGRVHFPSGLFGPYFLLSHNWRGEIGDGYVADPFSDVFLSPFSEARRSRNNAYPFSCSLLTHPDFWTTTGRQLAGQYASSRVDQVLFPSDKAMLHDQHLFLRARADLPSVSRRWAVCFVDGAAEARIIGAQGYSTAEGLADGRMSPGGIHAQDGSDGMHTREGVRGRDR